MYDKIKNLAERNRKATNEAEREAIAKEMEALRAENPEKYDEVLKHLIAETRGRVEELTLAEKLGETSKLL